MEKKNKFSKQLKVFKAKTEELKARHFMPVSIFSGGTAHSDTFAQSLRDTNTSYEDCAPVGKSIAFSRYRTPVVIEGLGNGNGYIRWGDDNLAPVKIEKLANALPYTAQGLEYLTNLLSGNGIGIDYSYVKMVNGKMEVATCPYEHAGYLLAQRIKELREASTPQSNSSNVTGAQSVRNGSHDDGLMQYRRKPAPAPDPAAKYANDNFEDIGSDETMLQEAIENYRKWKDGMDWLKQFRINSGSTDELVQQWASDTTFYNLSFLRLSLEQGVSGSWGEVAEQDKVKKLVRRPRIMGISYQPTQCSRFEAMDDKLHINHVYYAERWRFEGTIKDKAQPIVAYPCIEPATRWRDLENIVLKHQSTKPSERPCVIAPSLIGKTNSPYYPYQSWWSIFPSMIYYLTVTLMSDMATAKKNSTMWSKIIYIDVDWFEKYASQCGKETDEERKNLRDEIIEKIEDFLSKRDNNGKTITGDKYASPDNNKPNYSFEIVDVPQPTSKASLEDLEKLTSCIFFALGIHPALIGAVPGAQKSSSGTQQRELALLKQLQLMPLQKRLISIFDFIRDWNDLDPHMTFSIKKYVLSTLDRSNTGLVEDEN